MPEIFDGEGTPQEPVRYSAPSKEPEKPKSSLWTPPAPGTSTYNDAYAARAQAYANLRAERDAYIASLPGEVVKDALGRYGTMRPTTDEELDRTNKLEIFEPDAKLTQYESALAWFKDAENNLPSATSGYWAKAATSAAGAYAAADPSKKAAADFDEFLNRALGGGKAEQMDLDIKGKRQDMNIDVLNYNMGRNKAVQSGAANPFEGIMATDRTGPAPGDPTSVSGISSYVRDSLGNRDAYGGSNSFLDVLKGMGIPGFATGTTPNTSNVVFGVPIGGATYPQWKALVIKDLANRWANGDRGATVNITGAGFGDPDPTDAPGRDISARTLLAYANFVDAAMRDPSIANSDTFAPYGIPPQPKDTDFVLTPEQEANALAKEQWQATFDRQGQWHEDDLKAQQVSDARADARFQAQMGAEMARAQMQAALQAQGIAVDQARLAAEVAYQQAKMALDQKMFELDVKKFDWSKEQFNAELGFEMSKFEYDKLSDAEKMAFDRERFGYQQLKDATDLAFEQSKFEQSKYQFDQTYNLQQLSQQQEEQFRRDKLTSEERQFELGLAQDESQFVRNLDWQKEQAARQDAIEAEKLKMERAGKIAALGADPGDAVQREYFLRTGAEPIGTAVDAFTGQVANGGQQMTLSQVMQQNAPALRPFAQAGFGGGQQVPQAAAGLGVTHAPKFIVGDSLSGKPTGHEELVVNPTGAPLSVVPISKMYQTATGKTSNSVTMPRFAGSTGWKTTVPGLASDQGGFSGKTFSGSGGVANTGMKRPQAPQGFGGGISGLLYTGDAGAAYQQQQRQRQGMVYDPVSGQWYYPGGAPQQQIQQADPGAYTNEYGQFNGDGTVGTVAGSEVITGPASDTIQGNATPVGSVPVGYGNYQDPYSGGGQSPLQDPTWVNYATAAGLNSADWNAYNAWVAGGSPPTYVPPVVEEPPPTMDLNYNNGVMTFQNWLGGNAPTDAFWAQFLAQQPQPAPIGGDGNPGGQQPGSWVNQNGTWMWTGDYPPFQPSGPMLPPGAQGGSVEFVNGQWTWVPSGSGQQPGSAQSGADWFNFDTNPNMPGIQQANQAQQGAYLGWAQQNGLAGAPTNDSWAAFLASQNPGDNGGGNTGGGQQSTSQPVADAGLSDAQRNQYRYGGWDYQNIGGQWMWVPPPGFAAGTTGQKSLLDLLREALGVNVLSYGDEAYQNLPVLQYLSKRIGSAQYNTPGAQGSAIPALGVNLGSPGSLNWRTAQDINRSPASKGLVSSLYKAGNRDWDSEVALSQANAPTGSAYSSSLIRT